MRLNHPMRWAANDPLEAFINQTCLLATDSPEILDFNLLQPNYYQLDRDQLVQDETLLQQLFALLVNAHYQTRPSDLRQLLDAPNITLHVLMQQKMVLAIVVLSREGSLETVLSEQIYQGKRRPHGHPIPQSLSFHAKIQGAAELSCERIMRIAVLPNLQGKGLGQALLKQVISYARQHSIDYLGVSYAMSTSLIRFWENAEFQLARIGHRLDTASGSRSAIHVLPLSNKAQTLFSKSVFI
jgi:tRNA(Met) cytidine acetyltransferase